MTTVTQNIAILGSTGSIGTQTLDVIAHYPELFAVELLSAHDNFTLLAQQAVQFNASTVIITNPAHYEPLKALLSNTDTKVYCGHEALCQEVRNTNIHTVVTALTGFAGLLPTIEAIKCGKKIALANKETLVVAGQIVMALAHKHNAPIIPVDSEHSAIFQCLVGESSDLKRIILTASGGALRDMTLEQLDNATPSQVLSHPCWNMGAKVTVDSATMLNKGFEIIEAKHLFALQPSQIDVVIHHQSIIHSFVEFQDNALKAQLSNPDMRIPIQYALTFPKRLPMPQTQQYNPLEALTFQKPDPQRYPCLKLAYQAMNAAGISTTILNAAGEIAVQKFLNNKISYPQIAQTIQLALEKIPNQNITSIEQLVEIDTLTRKFIN